MTSSIGAMTIPLFIMAVLTAVPAIIAHRRIGRFWLASFLAAVSGTLLWFVASVPFALADGWQGIGSELPFLMRAFAVCTVCCFVFASVFGAIMRQMHYSPPQNHNPIG